ncbi:hypothetical protein ACUNV4_04645 [Granulosicoccus sp. 3-233]|uniref:hypothetical protein n=1 Tax=Granulosicoccus sp. 3-233 TaxID=3417969 RepID=UPI003D334FE6
MLTQPIASAFRRDEHRQIRKVEGLVSCIWWRVGVRVGGADLWASLQLGRNSLLGSFADDGSSCPGPEAS